MCFDCMQPMQKLSGDTLLKNLHPDLRLYVVKELSIPRPLGFCVLIFNFRFYSFHIVYIMLFITIRYDTIRDAILTCARKPT